jgi:hypothetical protein
MLLLLELIGGGFLRMIESIYEQKRLFNANSNEIMIEEVFKYSRKKST